MLIYTAQHSWLALKKDRTYIKFHIELIFQQVLNVPAFSKPPGAFFIRFESEPVIILVLVRLDILDEGLEFFFQPLNPKFFITRASFGFE